MEGQEGQFIPHQEMGTIELAEQLSALEKRYASKISEEHVMTESEIEVIANNMADEIEREYQGNDLLMEEAPTVLKYHSDHPDRGFQMKKFLLKTADVLINNSGKRSEPVDWSENSDQRRAA